MTEPTQTPAREPARFIYLTCQRGAERALKSELAKKMPDARFSYSRPGFLTYKLDPNLALARRLAFDPAVLRLIFARSIALSLGSVEVEGVDAAARATWDLVESFRDQVPQLAKLRRIHVYERDSGMVGVKGFEPGATPRALDAFRAIADAAPEAFRAESHALAARADEPAEIGDVCLDVAMAEENRWMIGFHCARDFHSRFPGGLLPLRLPTDAASRAFLKFEEGLRWSEFPIGRDSRCVDVGASPGGGSQALLARGAFVLGVDPALIDPRVLAFPNFTHLRGKINQLKRKLFRKSRWFITDMNVAPSYTLDALEELVARDDVAARGLLFTLKLFDWKLAEEIPQYLRRVKSWGFNHVKARQLQFNRQEIMVAALKKPFRR